MSLSPVSLSLEQRYEQVVQKIEDLPRITMEISIGERPIVNAHLGLHLTLADLRATEGKPLREKLIEHLQLQENIDKINEHFPFFERIKKVSYEILEMVFLYSLQTLEMKDFKRNVIFDVLVEDEAILHRPVGELERRNLGIFKARLDQILHQRPELAEFQQGSLEEPLQIPLGRLLVLSVEDILKIAEHLPPEVFGLLPEHQVKLLDFSKLSPEQIIYCIKGVAENKEATIQRRFQILSSRQLSAVFQKVGDSEIFEFFPESELGRLPVEEMANEQIQEIFTPLESSEKERRQRIAKLSPEKVNAILPKLDRNFLKHLTRKQILDLDYTSLSEGQLYDILGTKEKIAFLPIEIIYILVDRGFLEVLKHLSDDHLRELCIEKIPQQGIDLLFPPIDPANFYPGWVYRKRGDMHEYSKEDSFGKGSMSQCDNTIKKLIEKRKAERERKFQLLPPEQLAAVKVRLGLRL